MRHYGGGYHDVKPTSRRWDEAWEIFARNESIWMLGIPEFKPNDIGCDEEYATLAKVPPCDTVRASYPKLLSFGAFLMRPFTPLTDGWYNAIHQRLDSKYQQLLLHPTPYSKCCQYKNTMEERNYPFNYTELGGNALHPFQLKYNEYIQPGLPKWGNGKYSAQSELRRVKKYQKAK
jgi:hypothetical protein